jgi:hypothetical protein
MNDNGVVWAIVDRQINLHPLIFGVTLLHLKLGRWLILHCNNKPLFLHCSIFKSNIETMCL